MSKKRHSAEEIIGKLREVEVVVGRGGSLGKLIQGDRDSAGEPAGSGRICGSERPIKVGLV